MRDRMPGEVSGELSDVVTLRRTRSYTPFDRLDNRTVRMLRSHSAGRLHLIREEHELVRDIVFHSGGRFSAKHLQSCPEQQRRSVSIRLHWDWPAANSVRLRLISVGTCCKSWHGSAQEGQRL
jgi:hypothetical protein